MSITQDALAERLIRVLRDDKLSTAQRVVMAQLITVADAEDGVRCTVTELSRALRIGESTVAASIDRLHFLDYLAALSWKMATHGARRGRPGRNAFTAYINGSPRY